MKVYGNHREFKPIERVAILIFVFAFCAAPWLAGQDQDQETPPAPPATTQPSAPATTQPSAPATAQPSADASAPNLPASAYDLPDKLTLAKGTTVWVRTSQFISSDRNKAGDGFNATLAEPIVINGWVVARRGQTILGRVNVAKKAGLIKGVSQLGLELNNVVLVDGQQLNIQTKLQQFSGPTSRGRDAAAVATTTIIGTAIGGAAGGGEGAGVGAGVGAAAGLAGVLLTRGYPTVLPPETLLAFQLEAPVSFSTGLSRVAYRPVTQDDYAKKTLQRRPRPMAGPPPYPPPPYYYWGYDPWAWGYPAPLYFGFGYFGGGFGRGYRGGFRR